MLKKKAEPDILADFQIREEMLYQDAAEIHIFVSVSFRREIYEFLETLQSPLKDYFSVDGIKFEPWIHNPLLSDIDIDLARDELIDVRAKTYYN
jgi:hypothetical protein